MQRGGAANTIHFGSTRITTMWSRYQEYGCGSAATGLIGHGALCESCLCKGDEASHHCDPLERAGFAGVVVEDMLSWAQSPRSTLDIPIHAANPVGDGAGEVIARFGAFSPGWDDDDDDPNDDDDDDDDEDDEEDDDDFDDEDDLDDDDLDD